MFTYYCKKENMKKDQLLKLILSASDGFQSNEKLHDVLADLLGVSYKRPPTLAKQVGPKNRAFPFIQRVDYEERQDIIELVVVFVKLVIGEVDDVSIDMQSTSQGAPWKNNRKHANSSDLENDNGPADQDSLPPMVVILDTAQYMDASSWQLYEAIRDDCFRICLILLLQTDDADELRVHPEAQKEFESVWNSKNMEDLRQVDMPTLDEKDLRELLVENANRYQESFKEEVRMMTHIVDMTKTIKTEKMGKQWTEILYKKWQLETRFVQIDKQILTTITKLCGGNPYLSLAFFVQLLQNNFIMVDNSGTVVQCSKFKNCLKLSDFTTVPTPRLAVKINCSYLDRFLNSIMSKVNKRPGELESAVKSLVIMKSATVLGEEFELRALQAINPMKIGMTTKQIKQSLQQLESNNFIEIIDETD